MGDPGSIPGSGKYPEKEMAIYSSTLVWKIAWTEEPDRVQSMGSQRVDFTFTFSDYLSSILIPRKVLYFHAWIGGTANLPFESVFLIVVIQSSTRNNENSIYILTLF